MDQCVCCGAYVPEGRWICWMCEHVEEITAEKEVSDQRTSEGISKKRSKPKNTENILYKGY